MANLVGLQFKFYELPKKGKLPKKDANFFINTIETLITHDTITLEKAVEDMYEEFDDFGDFKEQLKCITVSDDNKFLFDYVDSFEPLNDEIIMAVNEIREELLEDSENK